MRRVAFFVMILLVYICDLNAQDTVQYYVDQSGMKCERNKAYCYRIAAREGKLWYVQSYFFPDGELQMEGRFADNTAVKPADTVFRYYKNGETENIEHYKNGLMDGLRLAFDSVGRPLDSCYYKKGQPSGYQFNWNEEGLLTRFGMYDYEGKGSGFTWHYHDNAQLCCFGKLSAGNKPDGEWIFYYSDGSVSCRDTYARGKPQKRVCYDPGDSTTEVKCKDSESPAKALRSEMQKALADQDLKQQCEKAVEGKKELARKKGRLVVDVCVEIDGHVTTTVVQPFDPCVDHHVANLLNGITVPTQIKHNRPERACEPKVVNF